MLYLGLRKEPPFSFFFSSFCQAAHFKLPPKSQSGDIAGLTHPSVSQCLEQFMDVLLNKTNASFMVVFLNSQLQQLGLYKVFATAKLPSMMGASLHLCGN